MKVVIAGGTGQLGTLLARTFHEEGHEVLVLARNPKPAPWWTVTWDAKTIGPWAAQLEGADVVINLAGRNVHCRYNEANKREILRSRVDSTRVIGDAIYRCVTPPKVWLQASTATIYAHTYGPAHDERNGVIGGNEPEVPESWHFSIEVAQSWERAMDHAVTLHTRKVKLRTAMVMSPDGGGFPILRRLVRARLGGKAGDGRQWMSWIHAVDFVRAVGWLIDHEEIDGVVNVAAPNPMINADFMAAIRDASGVRIGLPASGPILTLGTWLLRSEKELILKSRRVVPARLLESGFTFRFPSWPEAARDLIAQNGEERQWSPVW